MSDLTITTTNVFPGNDAVTEDGLCLETLTAGQVVYKDTSTGKFGKADANSGTAGVRAAYGVALNGGSANQSVRVQKSGSLRVGADVTPGLIYILSATAGGIAPSADLTTGWYTSILGVAVSTTNIKLNIHNSGIVR